MLVLSSPQPRVVAGVRKRPVAADADVDAAGRSPAGPRQPPRIAGVLRCLWDGVSRHCEVRAGSLEVLGSEPGRGLRLPLSRLHLRPHPALPRAFTLGTDPDAPAAAFQAVSEPDFSRWVRTLAVELLRQTPLDALRYLDVLAITATATAAPTTTTNHDHNHEHHHSSSGACHQPRARSEDSRAWAAHNHHAYRDRSASRPAGGGRLSRRDASAATAASGDAANQRQPATPPDSSEEDDEEREVAALLRRCQRADGVATVGDKRRLFEALCRRRARSQDALSRALPPAAVGGDVVGCGAKRARSLHDLRAGPATSAVRDMCRLFEERVQQQQRQQQKQQQQHLGEQLHRRRVASVGREVASAEPRKLPAPTRATANNNSCNGSSGGSNNNSCNNNSSSSNQLACRRRVRRAERRLARLQELSAAAEDKVWRLQEDMAAIDRQRSPANSHRTNTLYAALEQRLSLEEARLTRLQQESQRVLKEVEEASSHLEATTGATTATARDRRGRRLAP